MFRFLENTGEFFTDIYFADKFGREIFDKAGYAAEHKAEKNKLLNPLREKYYKFKNAYLAQRKTEYKILETHKFHTELLELLGYPTNTEFDDIVYLNKKEVVPVRLKITKDNKPFLYIMEMQAMIKEGEEDPDGIFNQVYRSSEWKHVFEFVENGVKIKPAAINEAISELFLLKEDERPEYVLMLAGSQIFLIHYEKWSKGSYLLIKLEELFSEVTTNRDYYAMLYILIGKEHLAENTDNILSSLDEESHKSAFAVTKDLKEGIIHAVELLANEAVFYMKQNNIDLQGLDDNFARELKDDCLQIVYRLLFLFYAESRDELDILPIKNSVYQKGYSLEMLRDLEQVPLNSDSSRNGYFFHESLWKLFGLLNGGYNPMEQKQLTKTFSVKPLDTPLFDDSNLYYLSQVKFRNRILQRIIEELSLSQLKPGAAKNDKKSRGRISYANLGINQLGSVYEGLLAYSGHFAKEDNILVKKADDPNGKDRTYLVPRSRRDEFKEEEILKATDNPEQDVLIEKDTFVYRLNGRDRQKSASYYTPEVLTRTTVKYTLKHILERIRNGEQSTDELLKLKVLEPAMGAAAFHNEVINQLADSYLELKQEEVVKNGGERIKPGDYKHELQKVKSYIALNNVYGVDINPTAIELGKLSLWLNVIHENMQTPYFGHKLGVGNAVIGCWRKVYKKKDFLMNPNDRAAGTKWWETEPLQLKWSEKRRKDQIYNFLLPDGNMAPVSKVKFFIAEAEKEAEPLLNAQEQLLSGNDRTRALKRYSKAERINKWRTDFCKPLRSDEFAKLQALCDKIDALFDEHYRFQSSLLDATRDRLKIYGQKVENKEGLQTKAELGYHQKEELNQKRHSATAPYFKLKLIMDYWCALWFWDVKDAMMLPTREQYLNDIIKILDLSTEEVNNYVLQKRQEAEDTTANDFGRPQPVQTSLFGKTPQQLSFAHQLRKTGKATTQKAIVDLTFKKPDALFAENNRLELVNKLAEKYKFFHYELEFIEVFEERGGFDVICGNPPWVNIEFDSSGILSETKPEIAIRNYSSPKVGIITSQILESNQLIKLQYTNECLWAECLKCFIGGTSNYYLLNGQRNNLYKCILLNAINLNNKAGFTGLVHPEEVYNESNADKLRNKIYKHLKYHFQFKNELNLFSEIHHETTFGINVYTGNETEVNFFSIFNLFTPITIDSSFSHNGQGLPMGFKVKDKNNGQMVWNTLPHRERIIRFTRTELKILSQTFDNNDLWESTKLISIHTNHIIQILKKLSQSKNKVENFDFFLSDCWNETNAVRDNIIKRITQFPNIDNYELIYSGPHFYVSNPLYKIPRQSCKLNSDYDPINLTCVEENFTLRTNYLPCIDTINFKAKAKKAFEIIDWIDTYRLAFKEMIGTTSERSLQSALLPPKISHVNTVISILFKNNDKTIELCSLSSSIIFDFLVKSLGKGHVNYATISKFPIDISSKFKQYLFVRTLRLNCLNKYYAPLWKENFNDTYTKDKWSISNPRLNPFNTLTIEWQWNSPLRNSFERRMALVEIDVIVAMALGLTLDELVLIYNVQFPVLQQNEDETFYDQKGNIVFTVNKGLTGVGVERSTWNEIKDMPTGATYTHTIDPAKSELYGGQQITYYAPFEKCDRVEDYRVAWEHFERVFKEGEE